MLTLIEALKLAMELKSGIDACDEYDIAYVFKRKEDRLNIGGDGACVILKEDGRAINQTDFFECYNPVHIRELDIDANGDLESVINMEYCRKIKETVYIEPSDYFPKELRKKYKLGEYNSDVDEDEREDKPLSSKQSENKK